MPLYDYQCSACAKITEVRHGFDEAYSQPCPSCGGALRRIFNPAPIVFKGSGFYVTDSRGKSGSTAPAAESKPAAESATPSAESKPAAPASGESAA